MGKAWSILCLVIAALTWCIPVARTEAGKPPITISSERGPLARQAAAQEMLAKAERYGRIGVVVGLDFQLKDGLSRSAETAQSERLDTAQDALIKRVAIARRDRIWKFEVIPAFAAQVTRDELERLLADPAVGHVTEDFPLHLDLKESTKIIHARNLWLEGVTGAGQTIAVLDSGVDPTHPMLAGKIVAESCYSNESVGPLTYESFCPNGLPQQSGLGAAINCPAAISPCCHGTHVAAIAAGKSNLFRGVAPDAKIIAVQVTSKGTTSAACGFLPAPCPVPLFSNVLGGLNRIFVLRRIHQIAAVNLSIGMGIHASSCEVTDPFLRDAITKLRNAGIIAVAAAGNGRQLNQLEYPACLFDAVAVGASTDGDQQWPDSNHDFRIKLMAPGENITSAVPRNSNLPAGTTCTTSGRYCAVSGTSQAVAHVSGALALLRQAKPDAKVPELLSALVCTGTPVFRAGMSRSRIDVLRAERELLQADTPEHFDFNSRSELGSWTQVLGRWLVAAGQLTAFSWPSSGTPRGEWVMVSHKYCSPSFKVDVFIDDMNVTSVPNTANGILLASNISIDGPTVSATGLFFGHNQIGQVFVERFENHPLRAAVSVGGKSTGGYPCASGPGLVLAHSLRVIVRGDGVYDFSINLEHKCTVVERQLPPPNQVGVLALRRSGEANHELSIRAVDIKPR